MERTKETLEARVRETPLVDRLKECQKRIGNMCAELRGPKMSIPVEYYDDDFYICTTLADAQATVEALQRENAQLQALVRELPVVETELSDKHRAIHISASISINSEVHGLVDPLKALLDYRRTLDATTPAPMGSNILEEDIGKAMMRSKGGDGE